MAAQVRSTTSTIDIYIKLAQYPILQDEIRVQMRQELFDRGIISAEDFEREVEEQGIESQRREGVFDPFKAEAFSVWEERKARIRAVHTDFYFAYNLPHSLFEKIVEEATYQKESESTVELKFNPEIAPWQMLFEQGTRYENLPPNERQAVEHHLEEIKVVLIRGMITDQLPLIGVAKRVLSISDLVNIYNRRIGSGKIGGKAAGMIIAWKILQQHDAEIGADISEQVAIPESYFIGTDVMYDFRRSNKLEDRMNQKYKPLDTIRAEFPKVIELHEAAKFPRRIVEKLTSMLENIGDKPVIVRSSSLLEDNFGSAFAGKYDSYFCPNQGTPEENLQELMDAIKRVYASTLNPNALLYRQQHGLIDYDERMAILIQEVRGERFGDYYFPTLAGVGFSQNPFRWAPQIRREDGFLRLVWGMGTRAVDRVSSDYPRLISLSHPRLRPETTAKAIQNYSQRQIDLIDLKENTFKTLQIEEVLQSDYKYARYIASTLQDGYLRDMISTFGMDSAENLVLTFDSLTKDQNFVRLLRTALTRLEAQYRTAVDVEFAVQIVPKYPQPEYKLWILQCRPLSQRAEGEAVNIPKDIDPDKVLFSEQRLVPNGKVEDIRYIVFVDPDRYREIGDLADKLEIGRAVGRINKALEETQFILMGPGRWGSSNLELGVKVGYADIYNTKVLIEIAAKDASGGQPELSYGTHFFQDLVEAGIYSLPLHLDGPKSQMDWRFLRERDNVLDAISPTDSHFAPIIRVIDLAQQDNQRLNIYMDGSHDEAVGLLVDNDFMAKAESDEGSLSNF